MTTTLRIAVPTPLRRAFDYLPPAASPLPAPGCRVRVPFGRRTEIGVVLDHAPSALAPERLRPVLELLDSEPLLPADLLALLDWVATYYHHPIGEVMATALPVALRRGDPARPQRIQRYRLVPGISPEQGRRAPRQAALIARLAAAGDAGLAAAELTALEGAGWQGAMQRLVAREWVVVEAESVLRAAPGGEMGLHLTAEQATAVAAVVASLGRFGAFLLEGITGGGKTEVYLQAVAAALAAGQQALVLVPEIGLTPQLVERFRRRFAVPMAVLHSGLADGERATAWLAARAGEVPLVLGTRSAIFTPLPRLGLIVVDEEHDASFKQQEGLRYSARDVAVVRAHRAGVPILLGSATPSLESLHNSATGRYHHLRLSQRPGAARPPTLGLIDLRRQPLDEGLSAPLKASVERHLASGGQVLLFLNRRGFSPVLLCHECGWIGRCSRCDAHFTYHAAERRLRCHHCGAERPLPTHCPACGSVDLRPLGLGTERIEEALARHFPGVEAVRIDRDATRRKGSMERLLARIQAGEARILIGTQMLAKGHHFPLVTLVGILEADRGLFSADFRASERMAQLILQVAGRAGRAERPGEVLIQTHHPDHPLLATLVTEGYPAFAQAALAERQAAALPPYAHVALLRAEATQAGEPLGFLESVARLLPPEPEVQLWGPVPAPMERRGGRYRAQLLLQSTQRPQLQRYLDRWLPLVEGHEAGRRVRWSLDVDPVDLF